MSPPVKVLAGYRFVQTRQGDTLQVIAARELRDARRWPELAGINGLSPPYLTGDPSAASARVKLYGQTILAPASTVQASATVDPEQVFGTDIALAGGDMVVDGGDLGSVSGVANLDQALRDRVRTAKGELLFHLDYGNGAVSLAGSKNGPTAGLLAGEYTRSCLQADPRVETVTSSTATVVGDRIEVAAEVQPISGKPLNVVGSL